MPLNLSILREWVDQQPAPKQANAAQRLGLRPGHLSRLLSGDRANIRLSTLEHFADVLGVEPAELIRRAKVV